MKGACPAITVMTCTYNGGRFIPRCYATLAMQTFADWEWLVIDDGSTDGSIELLEQIAASDPRVRVERHSPNRGRAFSRSRALELVRADWVALWDVDDFFFPGRLAAIAAAGREGYDYWVSRAVQTDLSLRIVGVQDFDRPFPGLNIRTGLHGAMAYRTDLGRRIGYQPHLTTYGGMGEDAAILYTLALRHKGMLEERPLMVNVTGHEVVVHKSMAAREVVIETLERLWQQGDLPLSKAKMDSVLNRMRWRNRTLSMFKLFPPLYPIIMRTRIRGRRVEGTNLEGEYRQFVVDIARRYPARGRDVLPVTQFGTGTILIQASNR